MRIDRFAVVYTLASIVASIAMGLATECWVGLLVYAICVLELLVILILTRDAWWWK